MPLILPLFHLSFFRYAAQRQDILFLSLSGTATSLFHLQKISFFGDEFGIFPEFIKTSHMNKGIPAVNTKVTDGGYEIELAAPGLDKWL